MRKLILVALFLFSQSLLAADTPGKYPAGVVYGQKAAFKIDAPNGWVLDNYSGVSQGLHCVLYPKGESWRDSKVVMYAKIASPEYPEKEKFMDFTIDYFKNDDKDFTSKTIKSGKTKEGYEFTVKEYNRPSYSLYEQTVYIQLPEAVAYIVYSAPSIELRNKYITKLQETLESFTYKPDYIER